MGVKAGGDDQLRKQIKISTNVQFNQMTSGMARRNTIK